MVGGEGGVWWREEVGGEWWREEVISPEGRWEDQVRMDQFIQLNVHSHHREAGFSPKHLPIPTVIYMKCKYLPLPVVMLGQQEEIVVYQVDDPTVDREEG